MLLSCHALNPAVCFVSLLQAALRESKEQAAAGQQAEAERHARERKELEAALDALQEKFHQLSELAETSKVRCEKEPTSARNSQGTC